MVYRLIQKPDSGPVTTMSQSVQRPSVTQSATSNIITHAPVAPPTAGLPTGTVAPPTVKSSAPTKFDLLADFGTDPFAASPKSTAVSSIVMNLYCICFGIHFM